MKNMGMTFIHAAFSSISLWDLQYVAKYYHEKHILHFINQA